MLVLLLLAIPFSAAYECPTYSCGTLPGAQCIGANATNSSVIVQQCGYDQVCPPTQMSNSTCQNDAEMPSRYPGDYCAFDADCASENCTDFVCVGLGLDAQCQNIHDCNPGFQCDPTTLTCQPQLSVGGQCYSDYQCQNNLLCSYDAVHSTTNCTEYFSVPVSGIVSRLDNEETGLSFACASAFAKSIGNGLYQCANAPVSLNKPPFYCNADSMCQDKTKTYSVPCSCSYTPDGDAICSLFPGDPKILVAIANMKAILDQNSVCNTYSRFSINCFATLGSANLGNYYNFAGNYTLMMGDTYPTTVTSSECLMQVFTPEYFKQVSARKTYGDVQCPIYSCNSTYTIPATQCWLLDRKVNDYMVSEVIYAQSCAEGYSCNAEEAKNVTCLPLPPTRYPGDPCNYTSDCVSGNCTNNVCTGQPLNANCTDVWDCNANLFCNLTTLTCQNQVGQSGNCQTAYDCMNQFTCSTGNCVQYFSLGIGTVTDNFEENGYSEACSTGYASVISPGDDTASCSVAPTSPTGGALALCTPGNECESAHGNSTKICECGFNSQGQSFCPYFEGDAPLKTAIANYKAAVSAITKFNCNTFSRNTYACFLGPQDMLTFFYFALNFSQYEFSHLIDGSDQCVVQTSRTTASYYNLQQLYLNYSYSNSTPGPSSSATSLFLGLAFFLVL